MGHLAEHASFGRVAAVLRRVLTGVMAVACCAAVASSAWAMSSGDLVGSVNGTTSQKGGKISPTFNVTTGVFYNASGSFRCSPTATTTYDFYTNGLAKKDEPAFHFGKPFTFKLSQRWQATKTSRYQKGKVTVTITGTIKELKPAPHSARGSGKVSGKGSVTFSAPGCKPGKLSWSGTGPLNYF
jgi:hypothetical protein